MGGRSKAHKGAKGAQRLKSPGIFHSRAGPDSATSSSSKLSLQSSSQYVALTAFAGGLAVSFWMEVFLQISERQFAPQPQFSSEPKKRN